ncbi:hypothetical protein [uncultured Croceitalea sp.]|uniref:hypothetical protein n=1 Tax=uncultured Croceitalea sp. TaxID=1798908 RepID=UPI0033058FB1
MIRNILAVLAGVVAAVIIFIIAESINGSLHPIPTDLDFSNTEAVKSFYENQPILFWLVVLFGWAIGSFVCGFLIKLISKTDKILLPIIAGIPLTLSAVANFFALPHPTWFIIVALLLFIPFVLLGHQVYKPKKV